MTGPRRPGGTGWLPLATPPRVAGPHLVLAGAGRGRLWDCSRARCWLASAGTRASVAQERESSTFPSRCYTRCLRWLRVPRMLCGKVNGPPGASPGHVPSPLHACSWLVSTFRISLTQAALTSGVGACAPRAHQRLSARVPEGRASVSHSAGARDPQNRG